MQKHHLKCKELSFEQAAEIVLMLSAIWPPKDNNLSFDAMVRGYLAKNREHDLILYLDGGAVAAHAITFTRTIGTSKGEMNILALAGVAVHPDYRKTGTGKLIVMDAFSCLSTYGFSLSLFQTGVPGFYLKLGAATVGNRFVNSLDSEYADKSPWWDKEVMIYPGTAGLPEGTIDLLGPAY